MPEMLYFAFGSNLLPARLLARTPSALFRRNHRMFGWRLAFHKRGEDGSGKGDMVYTGSDQDCVYGAIYTMTPDEKGVLDRIEGLGKGYNESGAVDENGEEFFFYVADPTAIDPGLRPYTWYHQLVLAGARWHRFPESYTSAIAQWPSVPDPDPARAERNFSILHSASSG